MILRNNSREHKTRNIKGDKKRGPKAPINKYKLNQFVFVMMPAEAPVVLKVPISVRLYNLPPVRSTTVACAAEGAVANACMKPDAVRWLFCVANELVDNVEAEEPLAVAVASF